MKVDAAERDELAQRISSYLHGKHVLFDDDDRALAEVILATGYRKCSGRHWDFAPEDDSGW